MPIASPAPSAELRPGWGRPLAILGTIALVLVVLIALPQVSAIVAPVFLSLNLVIAVSPFMRVLVRHGVHRILAATLTLLVLYAVLIGFVGLLVWSVAVLVQELPHYAGEFTALYRQILTLLADLGVTEDTLLAQVSGVLSPTAITSTLQAVLSNIGVVLAFLGTLVITAFFLFFDAIGFEARMERLREVRPALGTALDGFVRGVGRYWIVTTVFGLIVAVLDVVALEILHVPFAIVWGVFSFLTNYIPNIGFVIGMVPPVLMALLANDWVNALVVLVVWCVINFVAQSLIQPKVAGDAVGVTPTVSFLSVLVWTFALGPVGALLALPATLLAKSILIDADPRSRWMNLVIDAKPDLDAEPEGDTAAEGAPAIADAGADPAPEPGGDGPSPAPA